MLTGDTYLQGTAFPGDSLSTSTFWFPRLLLLCVPTFFLLLSQKAESTAPTLRAGGQSRILLTVSFWLQTGQEKASTSLHHSQAGGSPFEPSGGERGQWSRGGGRQVWCLVGSRSAWKESPGAEKKHSPLQALPLCREEVSTTGNQCNFPMRRMTLREYGACLTSD